MSIYSLDLVLLQLCNLSFRSCGMKIVYRFEHKPKKVKVEHDKKAKKRKLEYEDDEQEEVNLNLFIIGIMIDTCGRLECLLFVFCRFIFF